MTAKFLENLISNPQKMEKYKESPVQHAFLLALYEFSKQGYDFADLPWFRSSKPQQGKLKQAA